MSIACSYCLSDTKMCGECKARRRELDHAARQERGRTVRWLHGRAVAFYASYDANPRRKCDLNRGAEFLRVRLAVQRGEHDAA